MIRRFHRKPEIGSDSGTTICPAGHTEFQMDDRREFLSVHTDEQGSQSTVPRQGIQTGSAGSVNFRFLPRHIFPEDVTLTRDVEECGLVRF